MIEFFFHVVMNVNAIVDHIVRRCARLEARSAVDLRLQFCRFDSHFFWGCSSQLVITVLHSSSVSETLIFGELMFFLVLMLLLMSRGLDFLELLHIWCCWVDLDHCLTRLLRVERSLTTMHEIVHFFTTQIRWSVLSTREQFLKRVLILTRVQWLALQIVVPYICKCSCIMRQTH